MVNTEINTIHKHCILSLRFNVRILTTEKKELTNHQKATKDWLTSKAKMQKKTKKMKLGDHCTKNK